MSDFVKKYSGNNILKFSFSLLYFGAVKEIYMNHLHQNLAIQELLLVDLENQ